jgi:hypothetical protein
MSNRSTATIATKEKSSVMPMRSSLIQRQCACGNSAGMAGECSDCQKKSLLQCKSIDRDNTSEVASIAHEFPIQTKLTVGKPGDIYEQEADRVAAQVMSMGNSSPSIQPATAMGKKEVQTKRSSDGESQAGSNIESQLSSSKGGGSPLPDDVRSFMEPRFGADFSQVRVHTDTNAAQMNDVLSARAFTYGSDIYLNRGEYSTVSTEGKKLLAHELTHVIQQHTGRVNTKIQRDCSDSDFCKPYTNATEIANAKAYLLTYFVPVLEGYFGSDVGALWKRYLSRKPGDSLTPTVFNTEGNSIHDSFSNNNFIHDETEHVLDLVASRLSRGYGNVTQPITNFLSSSEMELNTDFANPLTIPGNIAGGIGSSDAGMDSRRITWGNVSFDITNLPFGKLVNIEVTLGFEVKDTVDLCPGDCGAILEQMLATIKMSRLEASGEAYDVPFIVRFTGPTKTKRVID